MTAAPSPPAIRAARSWLHRYLAAAGRPVLLGEIQTAARRSGISTAALHVAARSLGVRRETVRAIAWSAANREERTA
jgi:hypothetical protein